MYLEVRIRTGNILHPILVDFDSFFGSFRLLKNACSTHVSLSDVRKDFDRENYVTNLYILLVSSDHVTAIFECRIRLSKLFVAGRSRVQQFHTRIGGRSNALSEGLDRLIVLPRLEVSSPQLQILIRGHCAWHVRECKG